MHILLINSNPVVSRLFSLCARDEAFSLEETESADKIKNDSYDLIFVDDASYSEKVQEHIDALHTLKTIFLTRYDEENHLFDKIIIKPFLPSQIIGVIKEAKNEESRVLHSKDHFIFPLSAEIFEDETQETQEDDAVKTNILNDKEIEKIKNLLDMDEDEEIYIADEEMNEEKKIEIIKRQLIKDGLEVMDEEEFFESFIQDDTVNREAAEANSTEQTMQPKEDNASTPLALEETLLQAMAGMKVKKIRKLLKGAEINITISFKDKAK